MAPLNSRYLLRFSVKIAFLFLCVLLLLRTRPAQAKSQAASDSRFGATTQIKDEQDDWVFFPYTIKIGPCLGATSSILQVLNIKKEKGESSCLTNPFLIVGGSIDVGVVQIRRFICKHFHCYPKLGLMVNYGRLQEKGSLVGGLVYLEPQHDYLAKWGLFSRLGVGIVYADIPTQNAQHNLSSNDIEKYSLPNLYLELALALGVNVRLTPHWQLSPSIGCGYLYSWDRKRRFEEYSEDINTFTGSIALGYTPNPSIKRYNTGHGKSSRIDVGYLSAFRHPDPKPLGHDLSEKDDLKEVKKLPGYKEAIEKAYYIGGVYAQGSLPLHKNHALTCATEWIWDRASKHELKDKMETSLLKINLLVGYELRYGKCLLGAQIGTYLIDNALRFDEALPMSQIHIRGGLCYRITDYLSVGVGLKTKAFLKLRAKKEDMIEEVQRDYIDFRIGYSF